MHHGGFWSVEGGLVYNGGKVDVFVDIPECLNVSYVKGIINKLGYNNIIKLHYQDPRKDFNDGMRYLGYDNNTFDPFLALLLKYKSIHVYIEHVSITDFGNAENTSSFVHLLTSMHNPIEFGGVKDVKIDYDIDGTDEDDMEVVNAREKCKEDQRKQYDYEEELIMLKRLDEAKGKNIDDFNIEFDGGSDLDSPSESDEDDCSYVVAPEPHKNKQKRIGYWKKVTVVDSQSFT